MPLVFLLFLSYHPLYLAPLLLQPCAYPPVSKMTHVAGRLFYPVFDQPLSLTLGQHLPWDIAPCLSQPVVLKGGKVEPEISWKDLSGGTEIGSCGIFT